MIFVNREKFLAFFVLIIFLMPANDFGKTGKNLLNLMPNGSGRRFMLKM